MNNFEIFGNKEIIENKIPISLTFGNFDGVHLGHQSLLSHINKTAPNPIVVMIFDPHPANFFNPNEPKKFLTTQKQKVSLLLENGVDTVIVQKFLPSFALLNADEFCKDFLAQHFNIAHVFLGYNLSYGKNRSGNFFHMKEIGKFLNWEVHSLPAYEDSPGNIISSTRIRSALANGCPEDAEKLLGRPYAIEGTVFQGDQRGRELGYPTANIEYDPTVILPQFGVYSCKVEFPDKYPGKMFLGVMNCGIRPTVCKKGSKAQMETYILDFNDDVYGEKVIFHIKHFIRKEQKFSNLELLKHQMQSDVHSASLRLLEASI